MSVSKNPPEVLIKIFSYIDFDTLQKSCTLVCTRWKDVIRNNSKLSGDMVISLKDGLEAPTVVRDILSNWNELHTLRLHQKLLHNTTVRMYLTRQPKLKKIIMLDRIHQQIGPILLNNVLNVIDPDELKLPGWASATKICYEPKDFYYLWDRKYSNKVPANLDRVIELGICLNDINHPVDSTLVDLGSKMTNLESLCITFKSKNEERKFNHVLPLLKGLQKCQNLTDMTFSFDHSYGFDNLESFMKLLTKMIPSITRLEVRGISEIYLPCLFWIPRFKNLQKLKVKTVVLEDRESDFDVFFDNPMTNLRHFEICNTTFAFYSDTFLMKIKKVFPNMETFIIDDYDPYEPQGGWSSHTLLGVLHSIPIVKNMNIGLCMNLGRDFDTSSEGEARKLFRLALDVIDERFPDDTIDITVSEEEYGLSMIKEKGKTGKITQTLYEDHQSGLSIRDIYKPSNGDEGADLYLQNCERIHLSEDTINEIMEVAGWKTE